jgi:hypothetical protein
MQSAGTGGRFPSIRASWRGPRAHGIWGITLPQAAQLGGVSLCQEELSNESTMVAQADSRIQALDGNWSGRVVAGGWEHGKGLAGGGEAEGSKMVTKPEDRQ